MNKTFTWRLLTPGELTDVYLQEMRRDFPAGELKPLSMILTSEAEGLAHTWGVFDGETLAAYLLMVRPEGSAISQLDYFAVVPAWVFTPGAVPVTPAAMSTCLTHGSASWCCPAPVRRS